MSPQTRDGISVTPQYRSPTYHDLDPKDSQTRGFRKRHTDPTLRKYNSDDWLVSNRWEGGPVTNQIPPNRIGRNPVTVHWSPNNTQDSREDRGLSVRRKNTRTPLGRTLTTTPFRISPCRPTPVGQDLGCQGDVKGNTLKDLKE